MHHVHRQIFLVLIAVGLLLIGGFAESTIANPTIYEPGIDPGVGFNLVSWGNFANGATVWQNAVQAAYNAGFDEVSLSPVRFYTPGSGSIASSSSSGPELSHIAAGIIRGKQLGMRVTVNPFVEPVGFTGWRGTYNPSPGSAESNTFWNDYQQYLVDVAAVAQANGADSMTVGTELRALELNTGNNAKWTSVINAVDSVFSGSLGYASNWDSYNSTNTANTIWDHLAIDYIGIDSYFTNLLSSGQSNASGSYPNLNFITQVENAWNNKLDNEILPFAAARKGGAGLPVEFTEVGYLPYNGTTVNPQNGSGTLDRDEQNMAFEGLMRALDGRKAAGEFLATHIWQWDMQGSGGSQWNMNPNGGNQPTNQQTAQWLSSFVKGTNPDPGGTTTTPATQVLYSFEAGLDGFSFPGFSGNSVSSLAQATGTGATEGTHSLAITKTDDDWTWDARVQMTGTQLQAMQSALNDNINNYVLELDVTYDAAALPSGLSDLNMHVSFQPTPGAWTQAYPFADINGRVSQSFHVEIPLNTFNLTTGLSGLALHIGFDGAWPNGSNATMYIDNIALTDLFPDIANADFDGDGDVDGQDFLAWQRGFGTGTTLAQGDANGDNIVDSSDLAIWQAQFANVPFLATSTVVPEPATCWLIAFGAGILFRRKLAV
ncbi:glycoside hydrolase family 113 [Bythopirellula polymerisocia]|uniref:GTA TIM-barrel-like domain-containing protein n=1 Tax=Bythopirellula polymerisocia TaxID=2528003 RepID=A0A5C6CXE2_9BACT|nr:hypothetical protein [Bythopirellula polymerisocia]TWU29262.1 hypothetical protein Pla144_00380 [Bythopirellula polymerisocia]